MVSGRVLAGLVVSLAVAAGAGQHQDPPGVLESAALRAQEALASLWRRARGEAETAVQVVQHGLRRQEHDALQAASLQLEGLGVDLDLAEVGDEAEDDVADCAKTAQDKYVRLLQHLRRRAQRCWGWESSEVAALLSAIEDLVLAGDRLPALLRAQMGTCLRRSRRPRASATPSGPEEGHAVATPPSPFRVLRCTADAVNLTWTYVTSVPREAGRAARKAAALLGSSREDWAHCGRGVAVEAVDSAIRELRALGACVVERLSELSWARLHRAWSNPRT